MTFAVRAIRNIGMLGCLAMSLLLFDGLNVYAQQGETAANLKGDAGKALKVDVVFVLDNSGSMIGNDPQFITREVVTTFLLKLKNNFRVGMVTFDQDATLIEPLSAVDTVPAGERFMKSLDKIDYRGQFTNTPAGLERAIYELKSNGRGDAEKIIILLTDGIVDTGNKAQDAAGEEWLKDQLAMDCKNAGIRVFGVAFTEAADFRLIQTIALKTEGEYFRTFSSSDIPAVFDKIDRIISSPREKQVLPAPATSAEPVKVQPIIIQQPAPVQLPADPTTELLNPLPLLLSGLIVIVIVVVVLIYLNKKRDVKGGQILQKPMSMPTQEPDKGQAELIDAENVVTETDLSIPLEKSVVKIGRDDSNDIVISKDSISSLHATIEYRNGYYYLEDHRSTNGTKLNDMKVNENAPMRLKSGDKIQFAVYEFRFLMPEMAPYGETVMIQSNTEPNMQ